MFFAGTPAEFGGRKPPLARSGWPGNFARPHLSLKNPHPRSPAMAAGMFDHVWKIESIVALLG
jgi:hypothetical protein